MSLSKDQIRDLKYDEQEGMCPLCGKQIEKDPVQLNKRTGKPLATQKRLRGHWLFHIDRSKKRYEPDNVNLVHAPCGQNFSNYFDGTGVGRERLRAYVDYARAHDQHNRPAIILRDFVIRYPEG